MGRIRRRRGIRIAINYIAFISSSLHPQQPRIPNYLQILDCSRDILIAAKDLSVSSEYNILQLLRYANSNSNSNSKTEFPHKR
jgi:hypothetical protein